MFLIQKYLYLVLVLQTEFGSSQFSCLTWDITGDKLKLICRVINLTEPVYILDNYGNIRANCSFEELQHTCLSSNKDDEITANVTTKEIIFMVYRSHIWNQSEIWNCLQGTHMVKTEVSILKGIIDGTNVYLSGEKTSSRQGTMLKMKCFSCRTPRGNYAEFLVNFQSEDSVTYNSATNTCTHHKGNCTQYDCSCSTTGNLFTWSYFTDKFNGGMHISCAMSYIDSNNNARFSKLATVYFDGEYFMNNGTTTIIKRPPDKDHDKEQEVLIHHKDSTEVNITTTETPVIMNTSTDIKRGIFISGIAIGAALMCVVFISCMGVYCLRRKIKNQGYLQLRKINRGKVILHTEPDVEPRESTEFIDQHNTNNTEDEELQRELDTLPGASMELPDIHHHNTNNKEHEELHRELDTLPVGTMELIDIHQHNTTNTETDELQRELDTLPGASMNLTDIHQHNTNNKEHEELHRELDTLPVGTMELIDIHQYNKNKTETEELQRELDTLSLASKELIDRDASQKNELTNATDSERIRIHDEDRFAQAQVSIDENVKRDPIFVMDIDLESISVRDILKMDEKIVITVTGADNNKLLVIDITTKERVFYKLQYSKPWKITECCAVGMDIVALSHPDDNIIQMINIKTGERLRSFKVNGTCIGLTQCEENLCVVSKVSEWVNYATLQMITIHGKLIWSKSLSTDSIDYMAVYKDKLLYTYIDTLYCCDFNGKVISQFKREGMIVSDVTTDAYGNIYVSTMRPCNVAILSGDCKNYKCLFTPADELDTCRLVRIFYDKRNNCLLVYKRLSNQSSVSLYDLRPIKS
ncbi:unnamed protein product [Mytilus coruscus]|uniref:DZIP3-like HEPN domain-containing protein n=1 Tax=Mytilus coruscus TaxID=42192 RepID=A0A6J8B4X2_MYTCO|nr:unnamed protein product [Mytilus coruscus]